MSVHIERWIACDYGYCMARFSQSRHRDAMRATGNKKLTMLAAAELAGWVHEQDRDLCAHHAEQTAPDRAQPALFVVPDRP